MSIRTCVASAGLSRIQLWAFCTACATFLAMVGFSFTKVPFMAITQQVRLAKSLSSWERMHLSVPSFTMA